MPNRTELLDAAFDVVRRLRDFDQYGRDERRALAALRRRTGATPAECAVAYRRASELYDAAVDVANARQQDLWRWRASSIGPPAQPLAALRRRCPGLPKEIYELALWWIWYWLHLR
jgi:hypothetical protein